METTIQGIKAKGYAATNSMFSSLSLIEFGRDEPKQDEMLIDVLYCGVCHSDLHQVKNDWNNTIYPCVPGHEVIGKVISAGEAVTKFKIGDIVGVGCIIDSCGICPSCRDHLENYCEGPVSWTATYNGYMKPNNSDFNTFGGYSTNLVVKESFVLKIPDALDIKAAAPILCAGITAYSPLRHWNVKAGDKVGVVGIGGLGHIAIQLATAMGAQVTAITHTEEKRKTAVELGARAVIISENEDEMNANELYFDFILNTIPEPHDINLYANLLKRDGTIVVVGVLAPYKKPTNNMKIAMQRRSIAGSVIGGIQETQEVLNFCAEHHILPKVEMISIQDINMAFDRMEDEDVCFRFVIDMQSLKDAEA